MAFAVRAVPQILFVGEKFPEAWDRWLRYLSYAFICSIISVTLFMSDGRIETAAAPAARDWIGVRHSYRLQNQKRGDGHDRRRDIGSGFLLGFVSIYNWHSCPPERSVRRIATVGSTKRSDEEGFLAPLEITIR